VAGFLYFFPTHKKDDSMLGDIGVWAAGRDEGAIWGDWHEGTPSGKPGVLAGWSSTGILPDPLTHRWIAADGYWLGVDDESPPREQDLRRVKMFESLPCKLDNGEIWMIPVARRLPCRHRIDPITNTHERVVKEKYREYWQRTELYAKLFLEVMYATEFLNDHERAQQDIVVEAPQAYQFACYALAMNYRVNPLIVGHLGLLDDPAIVRVTLCAIEMHEINSQEVKKNGVRPTRFFRAKGTDATSFTLEECASLNQ
jgi:hypothetical protein